MEARWVKYAEKKLVGKKIVGVRYMSDEEAIGMDWNEKPLVIQFNDGSIIFSSKDDEGNGGGALFGNTHDQKEMSFPVLWMK